MYNFMDDRFNDLEKKLGKLIQDQNQLKKQINDLVEEFNSLDKTAKVEKPVKTEPLTSEPVKIAEIISDEIPEIPDTPEIIIETTPLSSPMDSKKSSLEEFIGSNLINKIGIILLIFGAGIGAKYAIEHSMISPAVRVILGYLLAGSLLFLAGKLKSNYHNYSAVLFSGGSAIAYFMTYAAYSFYDLIPQTMAFILMAGITCFTVWGALSYNRQVIGVIGMVGSYAVPFLLSNDSGQAVLLFSYILIINCGLLAVAVKKFWRVMLNSGFTLTWLIFVVWFGDNWNHDYTVATFFLVAYFLLFYAALLFNALKNSTQLNISSLSLLVTNASLFYGIGYELIDDYNFSVDLLGLFTLFNAGLHFGVHQLLKQKQVLENNLRYVFLALTLIFLTIAVPVQFDDSVVTIFWAAEAFILFYFGRKKKAVFLESIGYLAMILTFSSLIINWNDQYDAIFEITHSNFISYEFLVNISCATSFFLITKLCYDQRFPSQLSEQNLFLKAMKALIPVFFIVTVYIAFNYELELFLTNVIPRDQQGYYMAFSLLSDYAFIIYNTLFLVVMSIIGIYKIKRQILAQICSVLNLLFILACLTNNWDNYHYGLDRIFSFPDSSFTLLVMRYLGLAALAVLLYLQNCRRFKELLTGKFNTLNSLILHPITIVLLSTEIDFYGSYLGSDLAYKAGFSLLWGIYGTALIAAGIAKKVKYLRVEAIILFCIVLIKLFFYDMAHLGTIPKTIIFLITGGLLLVVSFLYNKYRGKLFD